MPFLKISRAESAVSLRPLVRDIAEVVREIAGVVRKIEGVVREDSRGGL